MVRPPGGVSVGGEEERTKDGAWGLPVFRALVDEEDPQRREYMEWPLR